MLWVLENKIPNKETDISYFQLDKPLVSVIVMNYKLMLLLYVCRCLTSEQKRLLFNLVTLNPHVHLLGFYRNFITTRS